MKAAALQMTSGPDVQANLAEARLLLEEAHAAQARLAVLPENFAFMGIHDADKIGVGESLGSGPACKLAAAPVPPARFVLIVPFATLDSVASDHLPLVADLKIGF